MRCRCARCRHWENSPMATSRDQLHQQFNFVVYLGDGLAGDPKAGFHQVSGIDLKANVVDYRETDVEHLATARVQKITGMNKSTDVTMKRGVIGSHDLHRWLSHISSMGQSVVPTVTIQLQNKDRTAIVATLKLRRARIIKHTSGPLNAKGSDVAMEELVLSC